MIKIDILYLMIVEQELNKRKDGRDDFDIQSLCKKINI